MTPVARPLLKWAGGKAQMLDALAPWLPGRGRRYIEPMIGGGAVFFALAPERGVIADVNPELIGFYRAIVADLDGVIAAYEAWPFDEETFYRLRALQFEELDAVTAAARLLYLNRGCFNGLYRVNRDGGFNVPWGRYKQPYVIERARFEGARAVLARTRIELGDFRALLESEAAAGDFIFLDPPYVPVSAFSDFKRYTRTQFHAPDHVAMADLVRRLAARGCELVVTNSNAPEVHKLYAGFDIRVVPTRRNVNAQGSGRRGEDVIVHVPAG